MNQQEYFAHFQNSREQSATWRELSTPSGCDFCSNDYLSFAHNPELKKKCLRELAKYPLGSTSSRLIRGQSSLYQQVEEQLSQRADVEAALVFPSGYQANLALLSALLDPDTAVFSDELNHASIIDGIRLGRAQKFIFRHNDLAQLAEQLRLSRQRRKFVVVESIYSMHGDFAPLVELADLCDSFGAHLLVDEAHATGLFGNRGGGRAQQLGLSQRVFARTLTAGKALGVSGAWIAGSDQLRRYLVNRARPFIYSTGLSFPQLVLIKMAWEFWQSTGGADLAQQTLSRIQQVRQQLTHQLRKSPVKIEPEQSPIIAVNIGDNQSALGVSQHLLNRGFDVRAIRPPTVPEGQARLRLTIPYARTTEEVHQLVANLVESIAQEVQ